MDTSLQERIEQLRAFYAEHKRFPSYSEMLGLFKLRSKQAIARFVDKAIDQGFIQKDRNGKIIPGDRWYSVKILGAVEAGFPSPAEEELADSISLDQYLITNTAATFLLRVSGESMINAGIHPNDLVLVERSRSPRNGDIVIARIDGEYTIKRLQRNGQQVVLMPENPTFSPIIPNQDLSIEGVVTSVIRKYY